MSLSREVDRAIAAENRRAIADHAISRSDNGNIYPPGTPEYKAYATALRAELTKWVNGEFPYSSVVLDTMEV